ncbi:hypothetical protein PROVRETT_07130 [Providencia rettgeri DSM 1131]|nr:hypothetical protein PROVRETT_07130 [Providencia rettgeri DSM 1131]
MSALIVMITSRYFVFHDLVGFIQYLCKWFLINYLERHMVYGYHR